MEQRENHFSILYSFVLLMLGVTTPDQNSQSGYSTVSEYKPKIKRLEIAVTEK